MRRLAPILALLALGASGCHCRHGVRCDAGKPFDFHGELDETGAMGGVALRDELAAVAGSACEVKSQDLLLCMSCRDAFGGYVTATHCADRMVPAYCAANCGGLPRSECLDEPGRTAVRRRCLAESLGGFKKAVPCCDRLELDLENERLVLPGSSEASCK